jgi:hypothetical protein
MLYAWLSVCCIIGASVAWCQIPVQRTRERSYAKLDGQQALMQGASIV